MKKTLAMIFIIAVFIAGFWFVLNDLPKDGISGKIFVVGWTALLFFVITNKSLDRWLKSLDDKSD